MQKVWLYVHRLVYAPFDNNIDTQSTPFHSRGKKTIVEEKCSSHKRFVQNIKMSFTMFNTIIMDSELQLVPVIKL